LDKKVVKRTRGNKYFQYLFKWKGKPLEDAMWMTITKISKYGASIEEFLEQIPRTCLFFFFPPGV
jgi:hypothetical protein